MRYLGPLVLAAMLVAPSADADPPRRGRSTLPQAARALGATVPAARGEGYFLPTPEGWRREGYAFPLPFAPALPYRGRVELRAPPGMETPGSEELWTYALLWWLEGTPAITEEGLAADLETYFSGLARSVARGRRIRPPRAHVREVRGPGTTRRFLGTLTAADPRSPGVAGTLTLRAEVLPCGEVGHTAVLFRVSPRPRSHPLWRILAGIQEGFACGDGPGPSYR